MEGRWTSRFFVARGISESRPSAGINIGSHVMLGLEETIDDESEIRWSYRHNNSGNNVGELELWE